MRLFAVTLSICLAQGNAGSNPANAQTVAMSIGTEDQQAAYLSGAATALVALNLQLAEGQRAFCPPPDFDLDAAGLLRLAGVHLQGRQEPQMIVLAAAWSLREQFPCQ
ncbi:MAG: hypothetical protein INF52_01035 [Rhodobacter sp.]|nr:hypothetical protein [Rhodobacter sp.]